MINKLTAFARSSYTAIDAFLGAFTVGSTLAVCTSTSLTHTEATATLSTSTLVTTLTVRATVTVACVGKKYNYKARAFTNEP